MTSLRRTVEGWMGDDLYRKLGDEPDVQLAWKLLRELIGQQLFATEYVTVPFIDDAVYYNQLFVFLKQNNIWSRLGLRKPRYKTVGNLDYLVDRSTSTWIPQFDFSPWDVADGLNMYREYKLRVASNRSNLDKSIDLVVTEAHARSAQPPLPGTLTIQTDLIQDLVGSKTIYVITDVVFASYLKLSVQIGRRRKSLVYDRDIPIGFKYRKFKMRNDGHFISEMPTSLRFTDKEAQWLRPIPQPVPTVPRWDPMRRRYTGTGNRRKMRHNLTIPTPEEPGRINHRGIWTPEADRGTVRVDRPVNIGNVLHARDVLAVDQNAVDQDDDWRNILLQRRAQQNANANNNPAIGNRRSMSLNNLAAI